MPNMKRVHVVDDEEAVRQSIGFLLRTSGFDVELWPDGETFLKNVDCRTPACVLLDVRMGGLDGLQVQAAMAEKGLCLPVIPLPWPKPQPRFTSRQGRNVETAVIGFILAAPRLPAPRENVAEKSGYIASCALGRAKAGAPDWIRTSDLCLRRAALYPAELRVPVRHRRPAPCAASSVDSGALSKGSRCLEAEYWGGRANAVKRAGKTPCRH